MPLSTTVAPPSEGEPPAVEPASAEAGEPPVVRMVLVEPEAMLPDWSQRAGETVMPGTESTLAV